MPHTHRYESHLVWEGTTRGGYASYPREHRVETGAQVGLQVSADKAFRGDPDLLNPERLLLAAASSCQLLSFLAIAARAGVDVVGYQDDAEALMPVQRGPMRITEIILRPRIQVVPGPDDEQLRRMVHQAHEECYIANTLSAKVTLEPTIDYV